MFLVYIEQVDEPVARLRVGPDAERNVTMTQVCAVRKPLPGPMLRQRLCERVFPAAPMITTMRLVDTFFPIAKGGMGCIPGPFGAGKTVLQQITSRHAEVDIVISSTSAPHYLITRKTLEPLIAKRGGRPLLLIDIAVPRDIEPEINFLDDVYVYNVDDLQAIADEYLRMRKEELAVCEQIITEKAGELRFGRPPEAGGDVKFGLQGGSA